MIEPSEKDIESGTCEKTGAHFYEMKGRRKTQEDSLITGKMPGFSKLSKNDKETVLKKSFEVAQATCGQHDFTGSTAILCAINKLDIIIANVGDSTAPAA